MLLIQKLKKKIEQSQPIEEEPLILTEEVKDEIDGLPSVTYSSFVAKKDKEISIEVSEKSLRKYDLTLGQISQAIRSLSIDIPSGSIENKNGEILEDGDIRHIYCNKDNKEKCKK